jgi:hypothetical protein
MKVTTNITMDEMNEDERLDRSSTIAMFPIKKWFIEVNFEELHDQKVKWRLHGKFFLTWSFLNQ